MKLALKLLLGAACVAGFYLGWEHSRKPAKGGTNPSSVALTETLRRQAASPGDISNRFEALAKAVRRQDNEAIEALRKGPLSQLTLDQLKELVRLIDSEPDGFHRSRMVQAIASRWAELDPDSALNFVNERVHRNHQHIAFSRIFRVLGKEDPPKAYARYLDTVKDAKNPHAFTDGLYQVFAQWKQVSPEAAFEALQEGAMAEQNADAALYAICRAESASEREAVLESIRALPNGDLKRKAWGKAMHSWAKTASTEVLTDWMESQAFDHETTSTMEREIARRKARDSPSETAQWLISRASSESLSGHLEVAVQEWAHMEPNACGEWLHGLELGPEADAAMSAFAHSVERHDIESAFAWAQRIHDSNRRERTLRNLSKSWFRRDNERLREVLASSSLSPDIQAQLLEQARVELPN